MIIVYTVQSGKNHVSFLFMLDNVVISLILVKIFNLLTIHSTSYGILGAPRFISYLHLLKVKTAEAQEL